MRNVFELDDQELEDCFDGSSNVYLVREILKKPYVVGEDGYVHLANFAQWFSYSIEGFIDADEGTEEWDNIWEENFDWGHNIAENINNYLEE